MNSHQFLSFFPNHLIVIPEDKTQGKGWQDLHRDLPDPQPVGRAVYFTPNGFDQLKREQEDVTEFNSIYIDVDAPKGSTPEEIEEFVQKKTGEIFPTIEPSFIVRTKNGAHFHFLLKSSLEVNPETTRNYIHVMDSMVNHFDSDSGAKGINRVLRVPGFKHYKNINDPYEVHLTHTSPETRYTLDEIAEAIQITYPAEVVAPADVTQGTLSGDKTKRLDLMLKKDHVARLYNADASDYDNDVSKADSALCYHLAFWFEKDPQAMEEVWLASPLGQREKTQTRKDYRDRTITHAIAGTSNVFTERQTRGQLPPEDEEESLPERDYFLKLLQEPDWNDKDWLKSYKAAADRYLQVFHKYFAMKYPDFKFEKGDDKTYWNYNQETGLYEELTAVSARELLLRLLSQEDLRSRAKESVVRDILANYRAEYPRSGLTYDDFDQDDNFFHAGNGWLNLKTLEFTPHRSSLYSRRKSAVDYNADATCPVYNKFLDHDLKLKPDQVRVIDQFSGLILTNDMKHQKMLTIQGQPGSGKSTLLNLWKTVLDGLTVQKKLTEMTGDSARFVGSSLMGKTLCWFDEVDVKKAEMGNALGVLITGDEINVERKGINGITAARNTLKCVLTANDLALASDHGIYRRLIMIKLKGSFEDDGTKDLDMPEKLKAEASGILNRMVRGLKDLQKMKTFTMIEGHEDLIEEYKESTNEIAEFLVGHFEFDPDKSSFIPATTVFNRFQQVFPKTFYSNSPNRLTRAMLVQPLNKFKGIERTVQKIEGKAVRGWCHLKLTEDFKFNNVGEIVEVEKAW